jgi:hypothetical protein
MPWGPAHLGTVEFSYTIFDFGQFNPYYQWGMDFPDLEIVEMEDGFWDVTPVIPCVIL